MNLETEWPVPQRAPAHCTSRGGWGGRGRSCDYSLSLMFADVFLLVGAAQYIPQPCQSASGHSHTALFLACFFFLTENDSVVMLIWWKIIWIQLYQRRTLTWHTSIPMSVRDFRGVGPFKNRKVSLVVQPYPEVLLWSGSNHADKKCIL